MQYLLIDERSSWQPGEGNTAGEAASEGARAAGAAAATMILLVGDKVTCTIRNTILCTNPIVVRIRHEFPASHAWMNFQPVMHGWLYSCTI